MLVLLTLEHLQLAGAAWIPHRDSHQESIRLGLRQRERALVIDGVLGSQHDERFRKHVGHTVNSDLGFFHRFEERGLRLRCCAVDLVGQDKLSEYRSWPEFKPNVLWIEDADP